MLVDQARIFVCGGQGGLGCSSLYKDIFNRLGVPDGGDGGDGGHVILRSDPNFHTLLDFKYNQHFKADKGVNGGSNKKIGRRGKNIILKVPIGTIVRDYDTGLLIKDLDEVDMEIVVARGGKGGIGNARKRESTPGEEGEEKTIGLELKLVADAGIIGFPNAGKSTLISAVSRKKSQIAAYPFTTKEPKLGVVKCSEETFVMADMPGLIEGAHKGKGLGDRFLKHIERTRVLVHLVDIVPLDETDPVENYKKLEEELKLYGKNVYNKLRVIVASKMDITGAEDAAVRFEKKIKKKVMRISSVTGKGTEELIYEINNKIKQARTKDEKDNDKDWYARIDSV